MTPAQFDQAPCMEIRKMMRFGEFDGFHGALAGFADLAAQQARVAGAGRERGRQIERPAARARQRDRTLHHLQGLVWITPDPLATPAIGGAQHGAIEAE